MEPQEGETWRARPPSSHINTTSPDNRNEINAFDDYLKSHSIAAPIYPWEVLLDTIASQNTYAIGSWEFKEAATTSNVNDAEDSGIRLQASNTDNGVGPCCHIDESEDSAQVAATSLGDRHNSDQVRSNHVPRWLHRGHRIV